MDATIERENYVEAGGYRCGKCQTWLTFSTQIYDNWFRWVLTHCPRCKSFYKISNGIVLPVNALGVKRFQKARDYRPASGEVYGFAADSIDIDDPGPGFVNSGSFFNAAQSEMERKVHEFLHKKMYEAMGVPPGVYNPEPEPAETAEERRRREEKVRYYRGWDQVFRKE